MVVVMKQREDRIFVPKFLPQRRSHSGGRMFKSSSMCGCKISLHCTYYSPWIHLSPELDHPTHRAGGCQHISEIPFSHLRASESLSNEIKSFRVRRRRKSHTSGPLYVVVVGGEIDCLKFLLASPSVTDPFATERGRRSEKYSARSRDFTLKAILVFVCAAAFSSSSPRAPKTVKSIRAAIIKKKNLHTLSLSHTLKMDRSFSHSLEREGDAVFRLPLSR